MATVVLAWCSTTHSQLPFLLLADNARLEMEMLRAELAAEEAADEAEEATAAKHDDL